MAGCRNQLIMKYYHKFLVSKICHIEFIIYIKNLPLQTFSLYFLLRNIKNN